MNIVQTMITTISIAGGLFAILAFIHFFVDWVFQSHDEAMVKHSNSFVRAKHCLIYTIGFVPLFLYLDFPFWKLFLAINILFWSHFFEDTYIPVFLWAKHIRKPPEMEDDPQHGFIVFISTPLGKILMIAIDQIIHLSFLFPIVYLMMRH